MSTRLITAFLVLPILISMSLVTASRAQDVQSPGRYVVTGRVIDAETNEGLPGASLQIEGTYSGTITSANGRFELRVEQSQPVLIVRFIGYETTRITVDDVSRPQEIEMRPSAIVLPEITISGEDPAVRIMRQVIENKKIWRKDLSTYAVDAYNRFRMENDTGIVSIWESSTRAFWDKERGVREISIWQQQTQNMDIDAYMPAAMFVINLYDDDIEVAGHRLMGVTHPDALDHYDFRLESIETGEGSDVYVISVRPNRDTFAGFNGVIRVLDDDYALLSVDLRPGEAFLFPPPIQYIEVGYRQQYSSFGGSAWLPVDLQTDMDVKVGVNRILVFPPFRIRQTSRLSDFEVNVPLPDSLYTSDQVVVVDSSVARLKARPPDLVAVPLSEQEAAAYATIDSTMTIEKAYKPTGALARFVDTESDGNGGSSANEAGGSGSVSRKVGRLDVGFGPDLWYNRVEGWHVGLRSRVGLARKVNLLGSIGWQTAASQVSAGAGIRLGRRDWIRLFALDRTVSQIPSSVKSPLINSADVMWGSSDYFDYYRLRGVQADIHLDRVTDMRVDVDLRIGSEEHDSLPQNITSSMIGRTLTDVANPSVREGTLTYARIELSRDLDGLPVPVGPQRKWTVRAEWGLGGDIIEAGGYGRYEADVLWRVDTFFKRRMLPNVLDVRMVAGLATSNAPPQRWGAVDGSTILSTFGSIKTADHPPYAGNQWAMLAWEHSFRTVPFEWVNWRWAIQRHWHVIVHGASGWSRFQGVPSSEVVRSLVIPASSGHHEIGVSLSGLFTVFRLDTAWRLDAPGFRIGISTARLF